MEHFFESEQTIVSYFEPKKAKAWSSIHSKSGETWISEEGLREAAILFVLEGSYVVSYEASGERIVKKGEMFFLPPACAHYVRALEDSHVITCFFRIIQPLSEIYHIEDLVPYCAEVEDIYVHYEYKPAIQSFLLLIDEYLSSGFNCYYFYKLKKEELCHLLFLLYTKEELATFFYPIIGEDMEFKNFVINNFLSVKNVQELAALANYSTSGFIKKFQRYFNESPYKWMQRQKARRILQDLSDRSKPLKNIAITYNFCSYKHFSDFCKAHYKLTPTQLRGKSGEEKLSISSEIGNNLP